MAALPDPGRSQAVLIGSSTYRHLAHLPAVPNNLSGFRDVLVAPALGGLPADHCAIVAEPAQPVHVYRTLRQHGAAAEDTLLVYFAGHGWTGRRNELFLCLPDTDPDELAYSAWPYDELRGVVADSHATKKVVILDCCFSGRALADQAGDEERILGQVGIEGTYLLTATAANAVALAPPGERYTAFTGTLLGLLNEGIPGGPELLTFGQIYPRLQHALTSRQLPRPRQQGSDTIAHLALTRNLAYTGRSRTEFFNERFTAITAQLSDAQPAVRLVGVHAMADLADDWPENRQACVDVLCGYLRLPYDPDPSPAERDTDPSNWEIRHTVIRVITEHLKAGAAVSWQGLNLDFTGAVFDGGDFDHAEFTGGTVSFDRAAFTGEVGFNGAEFTGGTVSFGRAAFTGEVDFNGTTCSAGTVSFDGAEFSGEVDFGRAEFSGGEINFRGAGFSGGQVRFSSAVFSGSRVRFSSARFSGGEVRFNDAKFPGGEVDFRHPGDWSFPPAFPWTGTPPPGVVLPENEDQSPA
jgi:Caspase domain/Pentapeptide repeats (9 copies)